MTGIPCSNKCAYQEDGFCNYDVIENNFQMESASKQKKCAYFKTKAHFDDLDYEDNNPRPIY